MKYTIDGRVRYSEADHTRKLTIPSIINYFQDCSIFQTGQLEGGFDFLKDEKYAWVLNSWQIVINRYPRVGENIAVSTWATGFRRYFGDRNFTMQDEEGEILAWANSLWLYMDMEKGVPTKPEQAMIDAYGEEPKLDFDFAPRKIEPGKTYTVLEEFPVQKHHIDTNEHVNNCQYVQMALDTLPAPMDIRQVRVEYKRSAVYGDIIVPKIEVTGERTVIELCDRKEEAYAVVELIGE